MIWTKGVRTLIQISKQTLVLAPSLHGHDYVVPSCFHSSPEQTQTCTWIISWHYSSAVIHHFCSKTTKFHIPELFSKHRSNNKPLNWKHSCIYGSMCFPRQSPEVPSTLWKEGAERVFSVFSRFSLPANLRDWTFSWLNPILLSRSSVFYAALLSLAGAVSRTYRRSSCELYSTLR